MNASTLPPYELGRAGDLERERPTVADLQRAQLHALHLGDRRRAAAYGLVVQRRVELAQEAASRELAADSAAAAAAVAAAAAAAAA
jgi:hypothetical protein